MNLALVAGGYRESKSSWANSFSKQVRDPAKRLKWRVFYFDITQKQFIEFDPTYGMEKNYHETKLGDFPLSDVRHIFIYTHGKGVGSNTENGKVINFGYCYDLVLTDADYNYPPTGKKVERFCKFINDNTPHIETIKIFACRAGAQLLPIEIQNNNRTSIDKLKSHWYQNKKELTEEEKKYQCPAAYLSKNVKSSTHLLYVTAPVISYPRMAAFDNVDFEISKGWGLYTNADRNYYFTGLFEYCPELDDPNDNNEDDWVLARR